MHNTILAIETSCDETAAAVIAGGRRIISEAVASSTTMYQKYGGIVPEVAAREQLRYAIPVLTEAVKPLAEAGETPLATIMRAVDAIAVTMGPGLVGSLLIGIETAKTVAMATGKPLIPVNHVLAHMYANFLMDTDGAVPDIVFPAISMVVSGGHTELFLMSDEHSLVWLGGTIDDAAGEAFDKTARLLGFGSRGGLAIQETAAKADPAKAAATGIRLPRPLLADPTLNFSFSGLKTAILREWNKHPDPDGELVAAFAREVQEAITDVLVTKTMRAVRDHGANTILLSGGVSANLRLREKFATAAKRENVRFRVPPVQYCTDNAAYIGSYAFFRGKPGDWHTVEATPDLSVEITE
jgi:N6-L-threonylcarbamoyladenine synthase